MSKYARPERERRWLLRQAPDGRTEPAQIVDRYIDGTHLRLRRVDEPTGATVYKLGQKLRPVVGDPSLVMLTNIYLDAHEYELFSTLPAQSLLKRRYRTRLGGRAAVLDAFDGELSGLVLLEIELDDGPDQPPVTPPDGAVEVTHDDRFSGGSLAGTSADQLRGLLSGVLAQN
jgi:hypothetical protein